MSKFWSVAEHWTVEHVLYPSIIYSRYFLHFGSSLPKNYFSTTWLQMCLACSSSTAPYIIYYERVIGGRTDLLTSLCQR